MQKNKFEAYIGFGIKSGKVVFGSDKIIESRKNIPLVIFDETANVKVVNKLISLSDYKKFALIKSKILLSELTKRDNVKVIGMIDKNLASAIMKNCDEEIVILKEGENRIGK